MSDPLVPQDGQTLRRFGDYLVQGLLGEGGMARIYAAQEVLSHRPVALKVLREDLATDEESRRRFLGEMKILANLDDPHIVRCLACAEIERRPVMVLERLEGWTLRQMLEQRVALPWAEAARYALQIARALRTAHSREPAIVHRDLKPENVMILPDGRVKVMDFGIAKILLTLGRGTTQTVGTPQYMSPEHIDAKPVDARADLFALGVLLWEMLVGHPPFRADSPRELFQQICSGPTPPPPAELRRQLPDELERLIGRLLAKDPAARPAGAGEVVAALEALLAGGHSDSAASPSSSPPPPPPRREAGPPSSQPRLDTIDIVENAGKSRLQRQVEEQVGQVAEAATRFAEATSAWIVRMMIALLLLPAAAVVFIGVPVVLGLLGMYVLEEGSKFLDFEDFGPWLSFELLIFVGALGSLLFIWRSWSHRRGQPRTRTWLWWWLGVGAVLIAAWIVAIAVELSVGGSLPVPAHTSIIALSSTWLSLSLSLACGATVSRLFRRLERSRRARGS